MTTRRSTIHLLKAGFLLGLLGIVTFSFAGGAAAHESRTIGEFELVVGFIEEPAIQSDTNGLSLTVSRGDQPVENLAGTLQAGVIFGEERRPLTLTPVFNEPGAYEAVFIPSQPGDYTFRITGDLAGTPLDEQFISSPDTFSPVEPRADYEFPATGNGAVDNAVAIPALVGGAVLALGLAGLALRRREGRVVHG
jgi:hypothetical protein